MAMFGLSPKKIVCATIQAIDFDSLRPGSLEGVLMAPILR